MKFFTARTLPIFEQCFGQNKEFFNSLLEHLTLFCSRLYRGVIGSFARAIFSQDTPMVEIGQWLEPHGLLHQKLPGGHMATAFCYML